MRRTQLGTPLVRHKTSNLSVVGVPQASHASDTSVAEEEGLRSYETNPNHVKLSNPPSKYEISSMC